jgi:hypothetical protein
VNRLSIPVNRAFQKGKQTTMKTPLPVTCIILKSACQAVCRHFSDQFRRRSTLRSGSLRSALTALLLAPLAVHAAESVTPPGDMQPITLKQTELGGEIGRRINDLIYKHYMAINLESQFIEPGGRKVEALPPPSDQALTLQRFASLVYQSLAGRR